MSTSDFSTFYASKPCNPLIIGLNEIISFVFNYDTHTNWISETSVYWILKGVLQMFLYTTKF